jgi:hypothetical protein
MYDNMMCYSRLREEAGGFGRVAVPTESSSVQVGVLEDPICEVETARYVRERTTQDTNQENGHQKRTGSPAPVSFGWFVHTGTIPHLCMSTYLLVPTRYPMSIKK